LIRKPASALATIVALAVGVGLGWPLARHLGPRPVFAAPAQAADFTEVAQRATPAVVNISAMQVFRTERSPFFRDPFFRQFFGPELPFRIPQEEHKMSLGSGVLRSGST
jgi:serine protease DegS